MILDGILFRLIDTAGLRETSDTIENMGIERSRKAAEKAQIVIHVVDNDGMSEAALLNDEMMKGTVIRVRNKADLLEHSGVRIQESGLRISAKNGEIEPLKQELVRVARESMHTAVTRAHEAIVRVQQGMEAGLSGELLSMDLHDCLSALGEVTGQITNQEILSNIFSKFCIGK